MRCYNLTVTLRPDQSPGRGTISGRSGNGFSPTPASIRISVSRRDGQRTYGVVFSMSGPERAEAIDIRPVTYMNIRRLTIGNPHALDPRVPEGHLIHIVATSS